MRNLFIFIAISLIIGSGKTMMIPTPTITSNSARNEGLQRMINDYGDFVEIAGHCIQFIRQISEISSALPFKIEYHMESNGKCRIVKCGKGLEIIQKNCG